MPGLRSRRQSPRFDREFHDDLVTTFKALPTGRRRAVIACCGVAAAGLFMHPGVLLGGAIAAFLLLLLPAPRSPDGLPTDEDLAGVDAVRDAEDVERYVASGAGYVAYERVLEELQDLLHREVSVVVGGGVDWRPVMRVCGSLKTGQRAPYDPDVDEDRWDLDNEMLFFAVGDSGSGFSLDKQRFVRGEILPERGEDTALVLVSADIVLRIYATAESRTS